jgi:hypothetical protein
MSAVQQELISVYKEMMLNKFDSMDTKTMNYWSNSISKGTKSIDDYRMFLLKSQDYQNLIKNTFVDVFYERVGDNDYQSLLKTFLTSHQDRWISLDDINETIVNSQPFVEKYTNVITSVYDIVKNEKPSVVLVEKYLEKFQHNPQYNVNDLQRDLEDCNSEHEEETQETLEFDNEFNEDQQKEILSLWNDKSKFLEYYRTHAETAILPKEIEMVPVIVPESEAIINIFEDVFKRNMNAREYIFYKQRFQNEAHLTEAIQEFKTKYHTVLHQVQELVSKYLDESVDEDSFNKRYLKDIDNETFVQDLKTSILSSDDYRQKMCERLYGLYKSMYGEPLMEHETRYIFEKVRSSAFELTSEDMHSVLVDYKNDTEQITERIFQVFISTYDREPDMYEQSKYIQLYRTNDDMDPAKVDMLVEEELKASLEYHDVIKQKIKTLYQEVKGTPVLPSIVYGVLQKTLEDLQRNTDVDSVIRRIIQEL